MAPQPNILNSNVRIGAIIKRILFEGTGRIVSLIINLSPSAKGCNIPQNPTTFGPLRRCNVPKNFRSTKVKKATAINKGTINNNARINITNISIEKSVTIPLIFSKEFNLFINSKN